MLPGVAVDGVGCDVNGDPPVGTAYHFIFVPVAVSGTAVAPWQYCTLVVAVGGDGLAVIITVAVSRPLSHIPTVCDT